MPTRVGERPGLGAAARAVSDRISSIVQLEIQLAIAELKRKAMAVGLGIGLLLGAAIFGLFALGFMFATAAAGLATVVSWWLALVIVTAFLFALATVLAFIGISSLSKGTPPVPEQAIEEARLTAEALKNGG